MSEVVGRVGHAPGHPERWALIRANGEVSNLFARDASRQDVAAILEQSGFTLLDDGTVIEKT